MVMPNNVRIGLSSLKRLLSGRYGRRCTRRRTGVTDNENSRKSTSEEVRRRPGRNKLILHTLDLKPLEAGTDASVSGSTASKDGEGAGSVEGIETNILSTDDIVGGSRRSNAVVHANRSCIRLDTNRAARHLVVEHELSVRVGTLSRSEGRTIIGPSKLINTIRNRTVKCGRMMMPATGRPAGSMETARTMKRTTGRKTHPENQKAKNDGQGEPSLDGSGDGRRVRSRRSSSARSKSSGTKCVESSGTIRVKRRS